MLRRATGPDVTLGIGLLIALLVTFHRPVQSSIELARELEDRFGLALVPGLGVMCLAFVGHYLVMRINSVARRRQDDQMARLAAMGQALSRATSMTALRNRLRQYLPLAVEADGVWAVVRIDDRWVALAGGSADTPTQAGADIEARADRAQAIDPLEMHTGHGIDVDGHICFHLAVGENGVGILGAPKPGGSATELRRNLASVSAVLGISIQNVLLLAEIDEHGMCDPLTTCLNRTQGMKVLDSELQRAKRAQADVTLLMLDLDHFKNVNDQHGHLCGDALLTAVGKRMHEQLRNSDVKIRYGGEEFMVLLPDTPIGGAAHVARILNRELGQIMVFWEGQEVRTTVSIGVAAARAGELDRRDLIARADAALYRAKNEGRNRISVDPDSRVDEESSQAVSVESTGAPVAREAPTGRPTVTLLPGGRAPVEQTASGETGQ